VTSLVAGKGAHAPYAAPEVIDGHGATPASDQFSLAAITYEWLFGRPIAYNGARPIEFRSMPGVDRVALSNAFTRALSPKAADRFASCGAFCDALAGSIVPELPLLAGVDGFSSEEEIAEQAPVLAPVPFESERDGDAVVAEDTQPDLDSIDPHRSDDPDPRLPDDPRLSDPAPVAVPSWNPAAGAAVGSPRTMESPRFGPMVLFLAVIVGAVFGFAAGYMARPRALQSGPPPEYQGASGASGATARPVEVPESKAPEAPAPQAPKAPKAPQAPKTPPAQVQAATNIGRLLVRSTPSGASVSVDGVARGETPLALRDLDFGTRTVVIARRGYIAETRRVLISKARPARTLEVRLAAASEPVPPKPGGGARPSTPATLGKPAVSTGSLSVDSRPSGAAVTINDVARGTTPLTIDDLAPGEYRIVMAMPGYRNFTTTVRVVAGERVRAAASLTALEQQ